MKDVYNYPTGAQLVFAVRRLEDGAMLDPADGQFKPPASLPPAFTFPMPEDAAPNLGSYPMVLDKTDGWQGYHEMSVRLAATPTVQHASSLIWFDNGTAYNTLADLVAARLKAGFDGLAVAAQAAFGSFRGRAN